MEYLISVDYLREAILPKHGVPSAEAKKRAEKIVPHIRIGLAFLREARASANPDIACLHAYYGLLNLLKVYVLLGPYHIDLETQRFHGVAYPLHEKLSQSLLTEVLDLKSDGAIPLVYRTLVGTRMPRMRIDLRDVYAYIGEIAVEYQLALKEQNKIHVFSVAMEDTVRRDRSRCVLHHESKDQPPTAFSVRDFKVLKQFKQDPKNPKRFTGKVFDRNIEEANEAFRKQFFPPLVYQSARDAFATPCCGMRLLMPEELPIILAFFHMGSVVRYNPEFLDRLKESKYWPMVSAMRQHSFLRILVLIWSYLHKQTLVVSYG